MFQVLYGVLNNYTDVTHIINTALIKNNVIIIPKNDYTRALLFSDPLPNSLKHIVFITNNNTKIIVPSTDCLHYSIIENKIVNSPYDIITKDIIIRNIDNDTKLDLIHSNTRFIYGSMRCEIPEQKLAIKYINKTNKILELGGNIGCNSTLLSSIVDNNIVVIEPDLEMANKLIINRDGNGYNFNVETSALSNRKLIRNGWHTLPETFREPHSIEVSTITYDDLCKKYNINFDTLVVDCEGAFYHILLDNPSILTNITLIIVENDYLNRQDKEYVDSVLLQYKFKNIERNELEEGGWPNAPCKDCFYEVWKKN